VRIIKLELDNRGSGTLALILGFLLLLLALAHFGYFDLESFVQSVRETLAGLF